MISQASPALGNGIIAPGASMAFLQDSGRISSLAYLTAAMVTPTLDTAEVTHFRQGCQPNYSTSGPLVSAYLMSGPTPLKHKRLYSYIAWQ